MIKLISDITVRPIQQIGGDNMVVAAAKVSTSGEEALQFVDEDANYGLINYLMKHRHGSVFEHASLTAFVHAPIFVWREWHRHRIGFSYNEESGRYKKLEPVFWIPRRDRPMVPVDGWKPGKPKFRTLDEYVVDKWPTLNSVDQKEIADNKYEREVERDRQSYNLAYNNYIESLNEGIALEVARCKLPVAIYSSCWVTTNPRACMAFLSLRTHEETAKFVSYPQLEIEEGARAVEKIFEAGWPLTYKAFVANGRVGP